MKITVEITPDGKFVYDYKIGEKESQHGECILNSEYLCLFTDLLRAIHNSWKQTHKQQMEDITCRAWIEKHPEDYKDMLDSISKEKK